MCLVMGVLFGLLCVMSPVTALQAGSGRDGRSTELADQTMQNDTITSWTLEHYGDLGVRGKRPAEAGSQFSILKIYDASNVWRQNPVANDQVWLGDASSATVFHLANSKGSSAGPTTVTVGTLDELYTVLATVTGGETILLEGGSYGDLYIGNLSGYNVDFPDTVTIASANPEDPAIFSDARILHVSNLTLDGVVFDYTYTPGDLPWSYPFEVRNSNNITIRNSTFDGDIAQGLSDDLDGFGYGTGLYIRDTTGFSLESSQLSGFEVGLTVYESAQITMIGNDIHSMRKDGMNLAAVQDVLIEDNHIHDFLGRPGWEDHRDMIQFWTNGTDSPNTNIVIRGNHLDISDGSYTQSIFMRNEEVDNGRAGEEMFYQNVLIEENVILNAHLHGITVGETDGLTIRNNTVIRNARSEGPGGSPELWTPRITLVPASRNVAIRSNVTSALVGQGRQSGWDIHDNLLVQDRNPRLTHYYGDVFAPTALEDPTRIEPFIALPGGPLDGTGIGASRLRDPQPRWSGR